MHKPGTSVNGTVVVDTPRNESPWQLPGRIRIKHSWPARLWERIRLNRTRSPLDRLPNDSGLLGEGRGQRSPFVRAILPTFSETDYRARTVFARKPLSRYDGEKTEFRSPNAGKARRIWRPKFFLALPRGSGATGASTWIDGRVNNAQREKETASRPGRRVRASARVGISHVPSSVTVRQRRARL